MFEPVRYDSLKVLPAAIALLKLATEISPNRAVTVRQQEFGYGNHTFTDDVLTVDWEDLTDPRHADTTLRLAAIARSLLDGTPVDLSKVVHFGDETGRRVVAALALIWDER